MKLFIRKKKITLREVAAPKPSRATLRVLGEVLQRAYSDQQIVQQKAHDIRSN